MCQRGDKRSVLQSYRVEAFALAAYVNPNNCNSYSVHSEASAYPTPRAACRAGATTPSGMHKCKRTCAFTVAPKRCTNSTHPLRPAGAALVLAPAVAHCTSLIAIPQLGSGSLHQQRTGVKYAALLAARRRVQLPLCPFDFFLHPILRLQMNSESYHSTSSGQPAYTPIYH